MKSEAVKKDLKYIIKDKIKAEEEKRDSKEDNLKTEKILQ